MGQTYLDVLIEDANPSRKVAAIFSNTNTAVNVPAQQESTMQASCELREDVQLLMFANHLHEVGKNVVTELIEGDHATDIKRDDAWDYEWQSNPNFTKLDPESPLVLKKGDTLRTTCTWNNSTSQTIKFPDEMCVFFGFFLAENDVSCVAGEWLTQD